MNKGARGGERRIDATPSRTKTTEGRREARAPARITGAEASEARRSANRNGMFVVRSTSLLLPCVREAPGARVCQREGACCVRASVFFPLAGMPAGRQNDSPNSSPNWVRVGVGAPTNGAALRGHVTHFVMLCPCPSDITLATALSAASAEDRLSLETSARTASRSWRRRTARWSLPAGAAPRRRHPERERVVCGAVSCGRVYIVVRRV